MSDAQPKGWLPQKIEGVFGPSWKTGLAGLGTFTCAVIIAADQFVPHPLLDVAAKMCVALGLGGAGLIGFAAKDSNVSGKKP